MLGQCRAIWPGSHEWEAMGSVAGGRLTGELHARPIGLSLKALEPCLGSAQGAQAGTARPAHTHPREASGPLGGRTGASHGCWRCS